MTFKVIKNDIANINVTATYFNNVIKALAYDIMTDIQSRFGKVGQRTASGGTVKGNSGITQNVKEKNTPLVGRTGKGRKLATEKKSTGIYKIGVTQSYMEKVLKGGVITAKGRGLIIPANKEAGGILRAATVQNGGKGSGITRIILDNNPKLFIIPGKNVIARKIGNKRIDIYFIFKKSIKLPDRNVLYFSQKNKDFIKKGIIYYLKGGAN